MDIPINYSKHVHQCFIKYSLMKKLSKGLIKRMILTHFPVGQNNHNSIPSWKLLHLQGDYLHLNKDFIK